MNRIMGRGGVGAGLFPRSATVVFIYPRTEKQKEKQKGTQYCSRDEFKEHLLRIQPKTRLPGLFQSSYLSTQFVSAGAMFSSVSTVDTFCNFLGAFIFNPMYIRSVERGFPGLPFLVAAILIIIPTVMTK